MLGSRVITRFLFFIEEEREKIRKVGKCLLIIITRSTGKGLPPPWVQRWSVECNGEDLHECSGSFSSEVSPRSAQWPSEEAEPQQQDQSGMGSMDSLTGAARTVKDSTDSKDSGTVWIFADQPPQWQFRCLFLEGFESSNRHIHFMKFIGWLPGVSKSLLLAC